MSDLNEELSGSLDQSCDRYEDKPFEWSLDDYKHFAPRIAVFAASGNYDPGNNPGPGTSRMHVLMCALYKTTLELGLAKKFFGIEKDGLSATDVVALNKEFPRQLAIAKGERKEWQQELTHKLYNKLKDALDAKKNQCAVWQK